MRRQMFTWYVASGVWLGCLLFGGAAVAQPSQCQALRQRVYELDALIAQNEQAAAQASEQARRACQGTSMVDCGYWSSYAQGLHSNVNDFVHERARLQISLAQLGCQ